MIVQPGFGLWPGNISRLEGELNQLQCTQQSVTTLSYSLSQLSHTFYGVQTTIFTLIRVKQRIWSSLTPSLNPIYINHNPVEQVNTFKYLALTLDNDFTFEHHITDIYKRSQQRLRVLRTFSALQVAPHLLLLLYSHSVHSVILFFLFLCPAVSP